MNFKKFLDIFFLDEESSFKDEPRKYPKNTFLYRGVEVVYPQRLNISLQQLERIVDEEVIEKEIVTSSMELVAPNNKEYILIFDEVV